MIRVVFFGLSVLIISSCVSTKRNSLRCEKFKNGTFAIKSLDNGTYSIIKRLDSVQVEINYTANDTTISSIVWDTQCSYCLRYLSQSSEVKDDLDYLIDSKWLNVQIIKANRKYYIFEASMNGLKVKYIDTVFIFKKKHALGSY